MTSFERVVRGLALYAAVTIIVLACLNTGVGELARWVGP